MGGGVTSYCDMRHFFNPLPPLHILDFHMHSIVLCTGAHSISPLMPHSVQWLSVGSHQPTLHRVIMTHPYFSSCSTLTRTWWEGCVGMSLSLHRCIITASGACILSNHITVFKVLGCFGSGIPHLCSNLIVLSK